MLKKNAYSQNGEDGILDYIFRTLKIVNGKACEFGAWDGEHFSNARLLLDSGWQVLFIESNPLRHIELKKKFKENNNVKIDNRHIDLLGNNIDNILHELDYSKINFLSIDIDGLDYQIFSSMKANPSVICVEVNAGHHPSYEFEIPLEVAKNNVGQSLNLFDKVAKQKGYSLICYTGNAIYIKNEDLKDTDLVGINCQEAYKQFIDHLPRSDKFWLYYTNFGIFPPYYNFQNDILRKINKFDIFVGAIQYLLVTLNNLLKKLIFKPLPRI